MARSWEKGEVREREREREREKKKYKTQKWLVYWGTIAQPNEGATVTKSKKFTQNGEADAGGFGWFITKFLVNIQFGWFGENALSQFWKY